MTAIVTGMSAAQMARDRVAQSIDVIRSCLLILIGLALPALMPAAYAETPDQTEAAETVPLDSAISREAWKERIRQARQRAERARRDAAARPRETDLPAPSPDDLATERILRDETLQVGDVIVTNKGAFVLRGREAAGQLILEALPSPR
ncbi:hypothetical protein BRADO7068 [Bradyrhizobium sp. ORS 278]|uniref:hypothetical protein n=1 Tax=Bradyrhizobium sp. (strain ORS 278) TaxID=114615 RepID=UPI000150862B|nr:hypothetical protein [Bradyrhizobium sp. ORS 278]CAL80652.1 hypothetical protein BRADO7068 [Bradyrhizobium sp. ORS 278]